MKSFFISALLIYLAVCFALFVLQRKYLYFPAPVVLTGILPENVEEITFETDGQVLRGWLVNKGHAKALLYYGGNAESIELNIEFFHNINAEYSIYLVPYRGYGNSTGSPSEQKLYQDALFIFDQLKHQYSSLSLMGRSLGSGVASYIAAQREIENLILVTPFDSIENVAKDIYWMLPVSLFMREKFRSWERVNLFKAKEILILVAENDQVITKVRTDNLLAQFGTVKFESVVIENAGHNDIALYPEYVSSIKNRLK